MDDLRAQLSIPRVRLAEARRQAMQRGLRRWLRAGLLPALGIGLIACDRGGISAARASSGDSATDSALARARHDSIVRATPGYVIDSLLPVEEEIRRFQAELGRAPQAFSYGARSREALVAAFVRAIERNDTTALARLVVNRREFGYLVYPASPNVRPPYRQSPQLVWLQRSAMTNKSAARLLERFGGRPLGFVGYECAPPTRQGANVLWDGCLVRRRAVGEPSSLRLFGPIIKRGDRFKFLSLDTGL